MKEIIYIDRSRIRPGKLQDVKDGIAELVALIEEREPQLLAYGFYIDERASRMTVVAVHPDADSVELHLEVGKEAFRGFAELIELEAIEVYGDPSRRGLEQLRQKADALGDDVRLVVDPLHEGFSRTMAASDSVTNS